MPINKIKIMRFVRKLYFPVSYADVWDSISLWKSVLESVDKVKALKIYFPI